MRSEGDRYEAAAERYLAAKGCRVLARNFSARVGEIDLVVESGPVLVFVEVKGRRDADPREAVNERKMERIRRAAEVWLARTGEHERDLRFDVVFVTERDGAFSFEHEEAAF